MQADDRLGASKHLAEHWVCGRRVKRLLTPNDLYRSLHGNQRATVLLMDRSSGRARWHKRIKPGDSIAKANRVLNECYGQDDQFLSVNQFFGWIKQENLASLRALFVDIDGNRDLLDLLDFVRLEELPEPTHIVFSGSGMHLYWRIKPVGQYRIKEWNIVEERLVNALQTQGADDRPKNCNRMLRLTGTRNSKNDETVHGLEMSSEAWDFDKLKNKVLGDRMSTSERLDRYNKKNPKKTGGGPSPVYDIRAHKLPRNNAHRWQLVYEDLKKIASYYGRRGIPEGYRDTWIFLAAVALSWYTRPETIITEITSVASRWTTQPIKEVGSDVSTVIARAQSSATGGKIVWEGNEVDPRYRFKRTTLWKWLSPIIPEDLIDQLRAVVPDSTKRKRDRERKQSKLRDAGHRTRDQYRSDCRRQTEGQAARARAMRSAGWTVQVIAGELGVSKRRIQQLLKGG